MGKRLKLVYHFPFFLWTGASGVPPPHPPPNLISIHTHHYIQMDTHKVYIVILSIKPIQHQPNSQISFFIIPFQGSFIKGFLIQCFARTRLNREFCYYLDKSSILTFAKKITKSTHAQRLVKKPTYQETMFQYQCITYITVSHMTKEYFHKYLCVINKRQFFLYQYSLI